jgi:hypothetical protein
MKLSRLSHPSRLRLPFRVIMMSLILCGGGSHPAAHDVVSQTGSRHVPELDSRIPEAKDEQLKFYSNSEWHNPFVVVQPDGVRVLVRDIVKAGPIKPEKLAKALVSLPLSAWPRGRAVALSQSAFIPVRTDGEPEPTEPAYIIVKKVEFTLRQLRLKIVRTPIT